MSGGGGGGAPAAVAPTTNTSTVQHASNQGSAQGGKGGGFGGPAQSASAPQAIQFGGYGQQSPFGMTNPQQWGSQVQGTQQSNVTNAFNPTAFLASDQAVNPTSAGGGDEGGSLPVVNPGTQSAPGSALSVNDTNNYANTIGQAAGVPDYNPATDVLGPDQGNFGMSTPAGQAQDALYNNQLATSGPQAGGIMSNITGQGDEWGSSLTTGTQSNVGLQDHALALGETVGQFSPITGAITGAVADNLAPKNEYQKDNRTAQEVSIDRHTNNWQKQVEETGVGFDPDDPSTWVSTTNSNERNDKSGTDAGDGMVWNKSDAGHYTRVAAPKPTASNNDDDGGGGGSSGGK